MRIKVLVCGAANEGGVKGYVDTIASNFDPAIVEWHITVSDSELTGPVPGHRLMVPHLMSLTYSIWSLPIRVKQLRRLLKQQQFDLLHLHTARAGLLGCLSSVGLPVAIVYTAHGWRSEYRKTEVSNPLFAAIDRYICSRASMVTVDCQRNSDIAKNKGLVDRNKLVTIDTRINANPFENRDVTQVSLRKRSLGIPDNVPVIGMVGRMEHRKDPMTFVRTAANVITNIPDSYFLWVGGGALTDQICSSAEQLGLGDRIIITGMRPESEVPVLLHMMNVLLFTSRYESLPLTILGAQAAHLPVVSSAYPGVEELVDHGITGYTFAPGDDQEAARYVLKALQDKEMTRRMVDKATARFREKHSNPQRMAQEYEGVYARVMQGVRWR